MAICTSYIKNPDALRFQKELFARTFGKHYSIMTRLTQCICQVVNTAPDWVKEAKARASRLVKHWKSLQVALNFAAATIEAYKPKLKGFFYGPWGETWSGRGLVPKWLRVLVDSGRNRNDFLFN